MPAYSLWIFHVNNLGIRRKECMKNFSTSLREHATNTINLKKNVNINKKNFAKMTPRYDRMLHLWKKIAKKFASNKKISES